MHMAVSNRQSYVRDSLPVVQSHLDEGADLLSPVVMPSTPFLPLQKFITFPDQLIKFGAGFIDHLDLFIVSCRDLYSKSWMHIIDGKRLKSLKKSHVSDKQILSLIYSREADVIIILTEECVELKDRKSLKLKHKHNIYSASSTHYRFFDGDIFLYFCGSFQGIRIIKPNCSYINVLRETQQYKFDSLYLVKKEDLLVVASCEIGAVWIINAGTQQKLLEIALFAESKPIFIHDFNFQNLLLTVSQGNQLSTWKKERSIHEKEYITDGNSDDKEEESPNVGWVLQTSVEKVKIGPRGPYSVNSEVAVLDADNEILVFATERKLTMYNRLLEGKALTFDNIYCERVMWNKKWNRIFIWENNGEALIRMSTQDHLMKWSLKYNAN